MTYTPSLDNDHSARNNRIVIAITMALKTMSEQRNNGFRWSTPRGYNWKDVPVRSSLQFISTEV